MADGGTGNERQILISANAAKRVAAITADTSGNEVLRVSVSGGGCSGFQYHFALDAAVNEDDHRFQRDGATVVIDETSLDLLAGAELDFIEDLSGAFFQMKNPNATASCGCGQSFAI